MNRKRMLIIGVVATVVVAGIAGAFFLTNGGNQPMQPGGDYEHDRGDGEEDDPIWSADDPGQSTFPENPTSDEDKMLGSREMSDHFYENYMNYRLNHDREGLYQDQSGLGGIARAHSQAMHENDYVGTENPDGSEFSPSAYENLQVSCDGVDRLVNTRSVTVIDENGQRTEARSEEVATAMFAEMIEDSETKEQMLRPKSEYDAVGVGYYITTHETDNGSVVADVYLTLDSCHSYHHDKFDN